MKRELSRRAFLSGTLAVGAATATAGLLAGCASGESGKDRAGEEGRTWSKEADVVVVGMGFAGLSAAYTAAQKGASVIVLEKAPEEHKGGDSRVSGQGSWVQPDTETAIAYFKELTQETNLADIDDTLIETLVAGTAELPEWYEDNFDLETKPISGVEFPMAQSAATMKKENTYLPSTGVGQSKVWQPIYEVVSEDPNVTFLYETPLTDLVFSENGEVVGVEATEAGETVSIKAKKGVIMAIGGYEFNEQLKANYLRYPSLSWGSPYNTGDGINICMKYDIDFWHMNSSMSAARMGCKTSWLEGNLENCSLDCQLVSKNGWIWVDKYGKRFVNEAQPSAHGFEKNALFYVDASKMEFPRMPLWQVMDEEAVNDMGMNGIGWLNVIMEMETPACIDKLIENELMVKADTLEELAVAMGVDPADLMASVEGFNEAASAGTEDAFGREAGKMKAIVGPYYAVLIEPIMVNTNGGPRHDANANILRTDGAPVERLYAAGEFGSIWTWFYQGGGNISECMIFGRIAAENAAALDAWDV